MALRNAGGMWIREGKKGKFLSGSFQPEGRNGVTHKFMAFKNTDKVPGSKHPDYKIVMTEDDERPRDEQTSRERAGYDDRDSEF